MRENAPAPGDLARDFDCAQAPRAPVILHEHPQTTLTQTTLTQTALTQTALTQTAPRRRRPLMP